MGPWLQSRTQMGWRDVDQAGFRAQGLLGPGAAGGQARSPRFRAGDWEDKDVTTGVMAWPERHLAFRVLTMETAPGSERVSQSARLPWLWEDSLVEAGQRGHPVPRSRLCPPCPSSSSQ